MPTLKPTSEVIWYDTPTPVPSVSPTPQQALILPILPATGGDDSGDGEIPGNSGQPLLPLAAAALGTSILLAANSRREEREAQAAADLAGLQAASASQQAADLAAREASVAAQTVATVNVEAPYLEVSTLAALAGVVKETFTGVWEDAVRISAADAPITIVRHYGMDMDEYNRKLAGWIAYSEAKLKEKYLAEQEAIAAAEKENDARRYQAEADRYSGLAAEYIANQERIKQENLAQAAADERAEQAAKSQSYIGATIAAYQEQKRKEEREEEDNRVNRKLTDVENETSSKNVYSAPSYFEQVKAFHDEEEKGNNSYNENEERAEQKAKSQAYFAATVAAYQEQKRKEELYDPNFENELNDPHLQAEYNNSDWQKSLGYLNYLYAKNAYEYYIKNQEQAYRDIFSKDGETDTIMWARIYSEYVLKMNFEPLSEFMYWDKMQEAADNNDVRLWYQLSGSYALYSYLADDLYGGFNYLDPVVINPKGKVGVEEFNLYGDDFKKPVADIDDALKNADELGETGGKIWTSNDKYVGETANAIDELYPGKVFDVNKKVYRTDGTPITDYDIELDHFIIQVKSGRGTGATRQAIATASSTNKEVIIYLPDVKPSAAIVKGLNQKGFEVFTSFEELVNYLK